ncbi:MAG: hypothetical protein ACI4K6_08300 [Candidatus Fimenecus sp.]
MKTTKKVLSVLLALAMLLGIVSTMAFAKAPDAAIDLYVDCDKDTYQPGDTVILTISEQAAEVLGKMYIDGQYAIGYNSNVIAPTTTSIMATDHNIVALQGGYVAANSRVSHNDNNVSMGDYIDDSQSTYGWDEIVMANIVSDGSTMFDATEKTGVIQFPMKISDTAADGTYTIGINIGSYKNWSAYSKTENFGELLAYDPAEMEYEHGCTANYAAHVCTFKVSSSAAAPVLTHAGRQVKMDVASGEVVNGTEQLRVVSSISNDDWNNYFANTTDEAKTTKKLLEVGIVATQGAFDMTAAQDAAKLGKGVHGDYTVATTTYIQNTGSDYRFGARIEYQTNVFDTTYVAFAKYLNAEGVEAYVFYDTSYALAFATNYRTITADYINFLNSQAA